MTGFERGNGTCTERSLFSADLEQDSSMVIPVFEADLIAEEEKAATSAAADREIYMEGYIQTVKSEPKLLDTFKACRHLAQTSSARQEATVHSEEERGGRGRL